MKTKYLILFAATALFCGCGPRGAQAPDSAGGTPVKSVWGEATLYIVEKDGYKFAVLIGYYKCAMVQIKD